MALANGTEGPRPGTPAWPGHGAIDAPLVPRPAGSVAEAAWRCMASTARQIHRRRLVVEKIGLPLSPPSTALGGPARVLDVDARASRRLTRHVDVSRGHDGAAPSVPRFWHGIADRGAGLPNSATCPRLGLAADPTARTALPDVLRVSLLQAIGEVSVPALPLVAWASRPIQTVVRLAHSWR
jgi:hypothetical protein